MIPVRQTENVVRAIAASLTPATLAAVLLDLRDNDQATEVLQELADYAGRQFARQLTAMVGERKAARMLSDEPGEPGDLEVCECGCKGVEILSDNGQCDHCNGVA